MTSRKESGFDLWCNVILVVGLLVVLLSLGMILPPLPGVAFFNFVLFAEPSFPSAMTAEGIAYAELLYGVLGSVNIGWMILLMWIAHTGLRSGDAAAWRISILSIGLWYLLDSGLSILTGYWQNAVTNTSLLLPFAISLFMIRRHIQARRIMIKKSRRYSL